jgi:hypothetical protein
LGHETGALLVACKNVVNLGGLPEGVVDWQDGAARDAGNGAYALAFEQAHRDLRAGKCFGHEALLVVSGLAGGVSRNENPRRLRRRGLGNLSAAFLPDPRRRVRNDAYDYDAYDDR